MWICEGQVDSDIGYSDQSEKFPHTKRLTVSI